MTPMHWYDGGTGITNFEKKDIWIYEAAVKEFGDPTIFIIKSSLGDVYGDKYYSLHSQTNKCLTPFWDLFDKIRNQ
jgi:hypothetical protein